MNQAKAATVASALISSGFTVRVTHDDSGNYAVIVDSNNPIDVSVVDNFATVQAIKGSVTQAVFT